MNAVLTVARKEARALFLSPVAVLFLGVFLFVTEFSFFTLSGFFARNLADIRPLFQGMPVLLILLVAAITMRQWAEERKMGTLEVLLTLPIRTRDLVLGKFLAGLLLVAVALVLTLPIPLSVSFLGDLDWGPVIGGYVGAMLLASAYLALGLCISSATDNQVVALMVTLVAGGLLYLLGSEGLVALFSDHGAAFLRSLGTGSRFDSIERGVLDLRDLAYYGSLTLVFLAANVHLLEGARRDTQSSAGFHRAVAAFGILALVVLNAALLNIWLAPLTAARADLTQEGLYSLSGVSRDVVRELDEPLTIQGIFSGKTHPKLAPLAVQVQDFLTEYQVRGGEGVTVEFVDPSTDEALEQELGETYGVRSSPFRVYGHNEQSVVNAYFHILIKYGDEHALLTWEDLIEVQATDDDIDVRLRNIEYDVTRAIRKVSQEFQTTEALFARYDGQAKLTAYVSPSTLPDDWAELPTLIEKVGADFMAKSGGKLTYQEIDPLQDRDLQQKLSDELGIQPLAVDLFGREVFYMDLVLQMGDKVQIIQPRGGMSENDLTTALTSAVMRAVPGNLKTLGVFTEQPQPVQQDPRIPPQYQQPQREADYQIVQQVLGSEVEVKAVQLDDGVVPEDVDVLLVAKPGAMTPEQRFALDQYLMRGGAVIALAGRYSVSADRSGLTATQQDGAFADMLATWGVNVGEGLVMDPNNAAFPMPVEKNVGGFRVRSVEYLDYPFFPDIRQDGFAHGNVALSGLPNVTTPWASPLTLQTDLPGVTVEPLLTTSSESWVQHSDSILPDFKTYPQTGFGREGEPAAQIVAATAGGTFPSTFADKPSPLWDEAAPADAQGEVDRTGRTLKQSLPDARLVVVSSAELASDVMLSLAQQMGGEVHRSDLMLLLNLVDWCTEDTDLLAIRGAGAFARTLAPVDYVEKVVIEAVVAILMLFGLLVVVVVPRLSRGSRRSLLQEVSR
ncbi:MAG: Gldg family protein [Pseudomonadota bacterium]